MATMMSSCSLFHNSVSDAAIIAPLRPQDSTPSSLAPNFINPTSSSHFRFRRTHHRRLQLTKRISPTLQFFNAIVDGQPAGEMSSADEEEEEEEEEDDEDDDDLCPVDCVREFKTEQEFSRILDKAKETGALAVVDFYRTSCGSCKYIEQGFAKLCKGSGDRQADVIFLKHNVIDEYDERTEVAERLRIRAVPLFHFYKNGVLLEAFPTRDKERIVTAILKYTSSA